MADNKKVSPIEELKSVEQALIDYSAEYQKQKNQKIFLQRQEQERALAAFQLRLESENAVNIQGRLIEFAKQFQKIKDAEAVKALKEQARQETKNLIEYYKSRSKLAEKEEKKKDKQLARELEIAKLLSTEDKDPRQAAKDTFKADVMQTLDAFKKGNEDLGKNMLKGLANLGDKLSGEINAVISSYAKYQSEMNTRLQGTTTTFQSLERNITTTFGMSPYVKTSAMLENLSELVAQGIAYNLEQRAFLSTVSDKIATTFDAANASLLRIVRLQQQDSTASRLGMEAYLTRYFNEMFEDTAYLSQTFDNVTAALVEATTLMGASQSVEFEYIVQKWLGSMSAVGASENTIQAIAEALGYLGSGNVSALSGSNMQNLLVMAASRAGLDYSSILTKGLNAYNTNTLLQALVGYMQEIGAGSSNVVKSQYAKTFGVSISDLTAVGNLQIKDIAAINANMMSYAGTIEELGYQLDQVSSRVSIAEKIQNVMTNIKFGIGQGIAQSPVMVGMWSITDLIQGVTGGIAIPAISVMGNMVDLNTTVENLIKTGIVGVSTLGKIGNLFTGLSNAADMSGLIGSFGINNIQATRRGTGLSTRQSGMSTSLSAIVGTSSGLEISEQALGAKQGEAQKLADQQKAASIEKSTTDIYQYLLNMFDPKMNSLLTMVGNIAGYTVNTTSWDNNKETRDYVFNYGTAVSIKAPEDDSQKVKQMNMIAQNVSDIYTLLNQGLLTVKVSNFPGN